VIRKSPQKRVPCGSAGGGLAREEPSDHAPKREDTAALALKLLDTNRQAKQGDEMTVSVKQAAQRLGVSTGLVRRAIQRGELRAIRFGSRVLIPVAALDELLDSGQGSTFDEGRP